MAFVSGEQGSGLLGRIFTALGNSEDPNLQHIALSPQGDINYNKLFEDYTALQGNQKSGLADFTSQYKSLTPQLSALDQLHSSIYGDLTKQAQAYDPTKNFRMSGDYSFGKLNEFLDKGMLAGNSAIDKQILALTGRGGQKPGGYASLLNANRITSNLLPAFNNIISNLTPLAAGQNNDYFRNIAQIPGLMQGQSDALQATPYRALVPSQIEQSLLQGNLGTLNNLVKGQLDNWTFFEKPSWLTTAGNVASGVYGGLFDAMDVMNKAASTYGNVMGSGLGGQMGMGGGQQPQSNSIDINQILSMLGRQGGGGGASGGMDINQIMQMIGPILQQLGRTSQQQNNQQLLSGPANSLQSISPYNSSYQQFNDPGYYQPPVYEDQAAAYSLQNPYSQYGAHFGN